MSFFALAWAGRQQLVRAADKLILLAYADRHNEETGFAYPSVAWLCEFSSLNRKTVIQAADRLEGAGLLVDTGRRVGRTSQVKVYGLALTDLTVPKTEPLKSPVFSSKESQKRDTEPIKEPRYKHRSRRCPSDFTPAELERKVGKDEGLSDSEIASCLAEFLDYEFANSHSDWPATFRNWLRKAGKVKRRDGRFAPKPFTPASTAKPVDDLHEKLMGRR